MNSANRRVAPGLIAVLGGECSGKTTLCQALAKTLPGQVVPEYLREWCEQMGRTPTRGEQRSILAGQLLRQRQALRTAVAKGLHWVVTDGAPLLTAAYSAEYFDDASLVSAGLRHARGARVILLTDPGMAWQADGMLRDGQAMREAVHARLVQWLREANLPFHRVRGNPDERIQACLQVLR